MSKTATYRILTDAADLIEHEGWTQGAYMSNGCYCLFGALHQAAHGADYEEAWQLLNDAVDGDSPIDWNDEAGRTKEEVLTLLRATATTVALT